MNYDIYDLRFLLSYRTIVAVSVFHSTFLHYPGRNKNYFSFLDLNWTQQTTSLRVGVPPPPSLSRQESSDGKVWDTRCEGWRETFSRFCLYKGSRTPFPLSRPYSCSFLTDDNRTTKVLQKHVNVGYLSSRERDFYYWRIDSRKNYISEKEDISIIWIFYIVTSRRDRR